MANHLRIGFLACLALVPSMLWANLAPKPKANKGLDALPLPGHSIQPRALADMESLEIQMVSEQVDMKLQRVKSTLHLQVSVTFVFKNHAADDTKLPVLYPVGPRDTMTEFAVQHDGIQQKYRQKTRTAEKHERGPGYRDFVYYEWDCNFPGGETLMVRLDYTMKLNAIGRTGYTVSTGGAWKGKIDKSVLTLAASEHDWGYVRAFGPHKDVQENEGRVVWTYADYNPGTEHDIWIEHSDETLDERCKRLAADTDSWANRVEVCELRSLGFYAAGRLNHTPATLGKLRQALAALIDELKEEGDTLTLPSMESTKLYIETPAGRDPQRSVESVREYAQGKPGSPQQLFRWLTQVDIVAAALPDEPETIALVEAWHKLSSAFVDKKLMVGKRALLQDRTTGVEVVTKWVAAAKTWLDQRKS